MAVKPPKGFVAFGSKKGGYRKRAPNGGYIYWYPDGRGGKGRVTSQKHAQDRGTADHLLSALEAALPADKRPMVIQLSQLLADKDQPNTVDEPSGEQPSSSDAAEAPAGAQVAEAMAAYAPPAELAELHGEAAEARRRAQTEVERHRLEQERQRMSAVAEALAELAPGISDEEVEKIKAAVSQKFGQLSGASTDLSLIHI